MSVSRRWTVADVEQIEPVEGERYEVIDGELHVAKQPSWEHQNVCANIIEALGAWNRRAGSGVITTAPGVIFSTESGVAPDVSWISRDRLRVNRDRAGHFTTGPELVVEVLSPGRDNEKRDREAKLALYSREAVEEYWIVDWQQWTIDVYRRTGDALVLAQTLSGDAVLTTPLLPGSSVPLPRLWPPEL